MLNKDDIKKQAREIIEQFKKLDKLSQDKKDLISQKLDYETKLPFLTKIRDFL